MTERLLTERELEGVLRRLGLLERRVGLVEVIERIGYTPSTAYTPTYLGGTTPGVTTYAANGQVGRYTRIGGLVFFRGRTEWTAATGTGNAQISLPFTTLNITNLGGAISIDTNNVTFANGTPQGLLQANATFFLMRSPITNAGSAIVQIEAAGIVNFEGFFEASV